MMNCRQIRATLAIWPIRCNIYETCQHLIDNGVVINRPPRDGRMAFIRSPDNVSIELLQEGDALTPEEPWTSMENIGHW